MSPIEHSDSASQRSVTTQQQLDDLDAVFGERGLTGRRHRPPPRRADADHTGGARRQRVLGGGTAAARVSPEA